MSKVMIFLYLSLICACPCAKDLDSFCLPSEEACEAISQSSVSDKEEVCEEHPWLRNPICDPNPVLPLCIDLMGFLTKCPELTFCDYTLCAEALHEAECGKRPEECGIIDECLSHSLETI